MRADEARAIGETAGEAFAGAVGRIAEMHGAIAERAMGRRTPVVRQTHDAIAAGVYATVAGVGRGLAAVAGTAVAATRDPAAPGLRDTVAGDIVVGALAGAFGERLTAGGPLAVATTFRHRGRDLEPTREALADAFARGPSRPDGPRPRVAVLIHGLCCTDAAWQIPVRHHAAAPHPDDDLAYDRLLERDAGVDVLTLRYDSGRRIPTNGADLADLLERLHGAWPGGGPELVLVGHSMGSLVARSACAQGVLAGHRWPSRVVHTVSLGGPHLGANLERATATVQATLGLVPETRPLGALLGLRSAGILDLRDGLLVEEDLPAEVDPWPWGERGSAVPPLPHARHHAVGATLSRDPESLMGRAILGDLLVTGTSATGRAKGEKRLTFEDGDVVVLGGLDHFDLLHHPRVYEHLRRWLTPTGELAGGPDEAPAEPVR